jgi:regulator of sigma E protease
MDGLVMTGQLLLGLSILIILHEAGHFFAARAFGIRVEKFYLFFDAWGIKLFSFKPRYNNFLTNDAFVSAYR